MTSVLITGQNSYIGVNLRQHLLKAGDFTVQTVSTTTNEWASMDFREFDVIVHLGAIVHTDEKDNPMDIYTEVNHTLPLKIAEKAKSDGVRQFVFFSTMSVYGVNYGEIDYSTELNPNSFYGISKLNAENDLRRLYSNSFKLAIVRPPMVYGKYCKGNYQSLRKFALKSKIFPSYKNKRSMIYITNLCEYVKLIIKKEDTGIFCPQNLQFVSTADMVAKIAESHKKPITIFSALNFVIKLFSKRISLFEKVFGDLTYDKRLSRYELEEYNIVDFSTSIAETEG